MKISLLIATALTGTIVGAAGVAAADVAFSPPPNPTWMSRPCSTPSTHFRLSNCAWSEEANPGIPDGFVRTFKVQDWYGHQAKIRCYIYSEPTRTGDHQDHCVSPDGWQRKVSGWNDSR